MGFFLLAVSCCLFWLSRKPGPWPAGYVRPSCWSWSLPTFEQKQNATQGVPAHAIFLKVALNSFDLSATERPCGAVGAAHPPPTIPPVHPSVSVSAGCLAGWVGDMLCTLRPVSNLLSLALSLTDHLHNLTAPKLWDTERSPLHYRPPCQHFPPFTHTHTHPHIPIQEGTRSETLRLSCL